MTHPLKIRLATNTTFLSAFLVEANDAISRAPPGERLDALLSEIESLIGGDVATVVDERMEHGPDGSCLVATLRPSEAFVAVVADLRRLGEVGS